MSIHELTAAKIKYLVTLLRLDPSGRGVRSVALAKDGIVYLCEKGKEIGKTYSAVELH